MAKALRFSETVYQSFDPPLKLWHMHSSYIASSPDCTKALIMTGVATFPTTNLAASCCRYADCNSIPISEIQDGARKEYPLNSGLVFCF